MEEGSYKVSENQKVHELLQGSSTLCCCRKKEERVNIYYIFFLNPARSLSSSLLL